MSTACVTRERCMCQLRPRHVQLGRRMSQAALHAVANSKQPAHLTVVNSDAYWMHTIIACMHFVDTCPSTAAALHEEHCHTLGMPYPRMNSAVLTSLHSFPTTCCSIPTHLDGDLGTCKTAQLQPHQHAANQLRHGAATERHYRLEPHCLPRPMPKCTLAFSGTVDAVILDITCTDVPAGECNLALFMLYSLDHLLACVRACAPACLLSLPFPLAATCELAWETL
jgi:hypothetical protein